MIYDYNILLKYTYEKLFSSHGIILLLFNYFVAVEYKKNVCKTMLNLEIVFQESIFQLQRDSQEFQWGCVQF